MPVHHHHRVVHVHIPKTAGTSMGDLFAGLDDFDWSPASWYGQVVAAGRHYELQHLTALELRELSDHAFDDYSRFAVVRDPYQRLISEFHWRRRTADDHPGELRRFETFDELLAAIPLDLDLEWHQYTSVAGHLHANLLIHLRPQWHYVCDTAGVRDDRIEIVSFERLADELGPLFDRLGVDASLPARPYRPKPLGDYFTPASLAVVNQVYATDFEWFGYEQLTEVP